MKSLKTDRVSVAKLRLADLEKEERQKAESQTAIANGKVTFKEALAIFMERLKGDINLKPRSKDYRKERVGALLVNSLLLALAERVRKAAVSRKLDIHIAHIAELGRLPG